MVPAGSYSRERYFRMLSSPPLAVAVSVAFGGLPNPSPAFYYFTSSRTRSAIVFPVCARSGAASALLSCSSDFGFVLNSNSTECSSFSSKENSFLSSANICGASICSYAGTRGGSGGASAVVSLVASPPPLLSMLAATPTGFASPEFTTSSSSDKSYSFTLDA